MTDHDKQVYILDIEEATTSNTNFRTTLWTGEHTQLTVMSVKPGEEIGLEVHHVDQFLRVEAGEATIFTGPSEDAVSEHGKVSADMAILVPAGTWHNFVNNGTEDLKLYSPYSPAEHDPGTIHVTKAEADAAEAEEHAKPTDQ